MCALYVVAVPMGGEGRLARFDDAFSLYSYIYTYHMLYCSYRERKFDLTIYFSSSGFIKYL